MDVLAPIPISIHPLPYPATTHPQHRRFNKLHVPAYPRKPAVSLSTHQVLDEIPVWDIFAWNSLIQTHLTNKQLPNVFYVYQQMLLRGVSPDRHTLPRVLAASRLSSHLSLGRQLHGHAYKFGLSGDQYVITALIEIYGLLDSVDTAKWLFDNVPQRNSVSWTMLIKLYLIAERPALALDLFHQMLRLNADIDPIALATASIACSKLKCLQQARKVHHIAKKLALESNLSVSNALLNMFVECASLEEACALFDKMPSKDIISWTVIIRGHIKNGGYNEGLKLFRRMITDGTRPDSLALSSVLPACARLTLHKQGKEIHGYLLRNGLDMNLTVQNAVMDMYIKSGYIELASSVFARMKERDVVSWTIMILGYTLHGQGELGVNLFHSLEKDSGKQVEESLYAAALHACSAACLVEAGKFFFSFIKVPELTHHLTMVALLARAGLFVDAREFIEEHGIKRQADVLRALLDGCRIHHQVTLGKRMIEQLCELEPLNAENYVLLSNWYADHGKWEMVENLRKTIGDMGLKPKKAYSWIEYRNKIHVFGTGDVSHPRSERIYLELQQLFKKMEDAGYVVKPTFSLHDVDEERECVPVGHSEMLAISFGLISTQAGTTVRIAKNSRLCQSCHDSVKFISKIVDREIIIKDPQHFHHFKNGLCSCKDYS